MPWWPAVGVVLSALLVHAPVLSYGFVNWDDNRFITQNPLFAAGGWTYAWAALTRVQFESYQPLWLLSYLPDRWIWPRSAAGFHAGNLTLFGVDVWLLFQLARRRTGPAAAAAAALLFAAHPLCVEPVAWISERKGLLAAAFFFGALLLEDRREDDDARASPVGLALLAGALLSKSATFCLPAVLWCWLVWMRRTRARVATRRTLPYALLALIPAVAVLTIWRQNKMVAPRPIAAPLDVLATLMTYVRRVVWPNDLAAIYPVEMPSATVSAALAVALLVCVVLTWRRLPPPARFAFVAFPIALLPVANVISINFRFADRYAFLALGVLVPPAAVGLDALFRASKPLRAVTMAGVTIAVLSLAATTFTLTRTWSTSRALWARAAAEHPDAYMARIKYGETLSELRDWPGAGAEFQAAARMLPINYFGYAGLLFVYASRAEERGRIPWGTALKWRVTFDEAQNRSATFDAFIDSVPHGACAECADILLLLRLRRWPRPDEVLHRAARAALDEGNPDVALVLLDAAVDKAAPAWRTLESEAARSVHRTE